MPQPIDILDMPILSLSDKDYLTARNFFQGGTLIVGDPASGKSSTSSKQIICAFMRAGFGGLLHTVKSSDAETYVDYARECGREADVILFNEASSLTFDPLAYEWSRTTGRGAGSIEACIDFFTTLMSIGKPQGGSTNEHFWELASEQGMRHSIQLIKLAGDPLSIININRAITSFPTHPGEHDEEAWQKHSYTASLIKAIEARKDTLTKHQWQDLDFAVEFICFQWAALDERPRSSIVLTFSGLADKFLFHPLRTVFASGTYSFTPEQATHDHKLIIVDYPVNEYGKSTAQLIQIMVKLTFQRAWLRHLYKPGCCHGACLIQDEFQLLTSRFESHFAQTCRDSGIAMLSITQSILGLAEELGESQIGSKTKAFLNNMGTKIAHRTTCPDTSTYFADVIGKSYRYLDNFNSGSSGESNHTHTSVGGSRQLAYNVEPAEFSSLSRPDSTTPYASAIVFCGGSILNATKTERNPRGANYLRVLFSRE